MSRKIDAGKRSGKMIPLSSLLEDMPDIQVVMDFNFRPACHKSLFYEKTAGVKFGRGEEVFGEEK